MRCIANWRPGRTLITKLELQDRDPLTIQNQRERTALRGVGTMDHHRNPGSRPAPKACGSSELSVRAMAATLGQPREKSLRKKKNHRRQLFRCETMLL